MKIEIQILFIKIISKNLKSSFGSSFGASSKPSESSENRSFAGFRRNESEGGAERGFGERKTFGFGGGDNNGGERRGYGGERGPMKCFNCQETGHSSKDCQNPKKEREPMKCFNCQETGHGSRDCPNPKKEREGGFTRRSDQDGEKSGGFSFNRNNDDSSERRGFGSGAGGERGPMKCFNCQETGHSSKDCQNPKKEREPMKCFNCQETGHGSRDCPNPKKEREARFGRDSEKTGGGECFNCKKSGHRASECTEPRPDGEKPRERYMPADLDESEASLFQKTSVGINFEKQNEIPVKLTGKDSEAIKPMNTFSEAKFSDLLMENVNKSGYTKPTPVQRYAIPVMMQKRDIMACAQTGSGKTAAYLLPIMTNILHDGIESSAFSVVQEPQALILSPTRELALQILKEAKKFSYGSIIKSGILYGGVDFGHQIRQLNQGCNILIATPGRLLDALEKQKISLAKVKYFVLDEADRMIDQGFEPVVREILTKGQVSNFTIFYYVNCQKK